MTKKVLIFGGCISTEMFNLSAVSDKFSLVGYYPCSSLAAIGLLPLDVDYRLLCNDKYNIKQEKFENDIAKQFLMDIINVDFDLLLINFLNDRFDFIEISPV